MRRFGAALLAAALLTGGAANAQQTTLTPDVGRIAALEQRMRANYILRIDACILFVPVTARVESPMSPATLMRWIEISQACWNVEPSVNAGFALARFKERAGDQAGADAAVAAIEARFHETAPVLVGKAGRAARAGHTGEATALVDQAVALGPERNERDPDNWTALTVPLLGGDAVLPLRLRIYDEAWNRAQRRNDRGEKVRILNQRAYTLIEADRYADALTDLEAAMPFTTDDNRDDVLLNRARAKLALGDAEGARKDFGDARQLSSEVVWREGVYRRDREADAAPPECNVAVRRANGLSTVADDDVDATMAAADACIAAGHRAIGLTLRASERSRLGDRTAALSMLDEAIAADANYAPAYAVRADTLHALQRNEEAVTAYERASALAPQNSRYHFSRADLLISMNDRQAARLAQEEAIRLDPRGSTDMANYVRNLVALGDHRCAVAAIDAAGRARLSSTELANIRVTEWREVTRAYGREDRGCPTPVDIGSSFAF